MIPENQAHQPKPNFERIAELSIPKFFRGDIDSFKEQLEIRVNKLKEMWDDIEKDKISYPFDQNLVKLLEEKQLGTLLPDFKMMLCLFCDWYKKDKVQIIKDSELDFFELFQALVFLSQNNQVEIIIKSLNKKEKITIKRPKSLEVIQESLLDYWHKLNNEPVNLDILHLWKPILINSLKYKRQESLNINNFSKIFGNSLHTIKNKIFKKGRQEGNYQIHVISYNLWKYLQTFTDFKSDIEHSPSNEQARFIFRLLEIHGMIKNPELITKKEDVISYYVKKVARKAESGRRRNNPPFN